MTQGWKPSGADPAAPQKEFYRPPDPPDLGHPETDPPMTVRVESWAQRYNPMVRRVIKNDASVIVPWWQITGGTHRGFTSAAVRDWPIAPPITYTTAFRHELHRQERVAAGIEWGSGCGCRFRGPGPEERPTDTRVRSCPEHAERGDMGVEAFKG